MFEAYNATLRNVIRDLPVHYQTIVQQACSANHDCSILALGSCNVCQSYLAFRYGNITRIHAPTDEYNFMKELSLSFHAACQFIKDRHITPQIRRAQEDKRQVLQTLPRANSNAPCARPHLDEHICPSAPPCNEEHLSNHVCPQCEEEHLEEHECPAPAPCEQEHLSDHTCPTTCTEPHLANHQCPVVTRDPIGHVCYHLECLGPCRVSPDPRTPQENISSIPGAFNSFSSIVTGLENALSTINEETASISTIVEPTLPSPPPVTTDPTICPSCQHPLASRHHRYECNLAEPRSPSPVLSEPETTTSMSTATRRIVRHRRRIRQPDGSYLFDGRRLPMGMSRPSDIPSDTLRRISNLDHSESSEEEYEVEVPIASLAPTEATNETTEAPRPVTPPQIITTSPLFGAPSNEAPPTSAFVLPSRSLFTRNDDFVMPQAPEIATSRTFRDFAPPRQRNAPTTTFGLQSPAPSSSSTSSGLFAAIPSFQEFQLSQGPQGIQDQSIQDIENDSD